MPLHVVCRGEKCRSVTSVISPRGGRCTGGCRPAGTACPRVSSPVEDLEGVGGEPSVGHEPSVEAEVEGNPLDVVEFAMVVVLLLELHMEFLFELLFPFEFLPDEGPPVQAEGAGTRGEGHLGGGQAHIEGQLALHGEARQLTRQELVSS